MEKMAVAGSSREFYRIKNTEADFATAGFKTAHTTAANLRAGDKSTAVLMIWDGNDKDWDYFLALNEIDELKNLIPSIIEEKRAENKLLVRDCGNFTLKNLFEIYKNNAEIQKKMLENIAEKLTFWQSVKIPDTNIISSRIFGMSDLLWESDYFREHISPLFPETKNLFFSEAFDEERRTLAKEADKLPKCLMHRDFQSENIVFFNDNVCDSLQAKVFEPSFVDVQGVRTGPKFYDAASLIFDPYLYPQINGELRNSFLQKMRIEDKTALHLCALQRLMQAMGAYGNLSKNKGKPHYGAFIKPAAVQAAQICKEVGFFKILQEIFDITSR